MKTKVSKVEYKQTIDEILQMNAALTLKFDKYTVNAINRLIMARIKIENTTIDE